MRRLRDCAVVPFLLCLVGISLFLLAVMGGRHVMCQTHDNALSYCATAVSK